MRLYPDMFSKATVWQNICQKVVLNFWVQRPCTMNENYQTVICHQTFLNSFVAGPSAGYVLYLQLLQVKIDLWHTPN